MSDKYMKGYRLRIYPTEEQKKLINRYIDLYRVVYNWGKSIQFIYQCSRRIGHGFFMVKLNVYIR